MMQENYIKTIMIEAKTMQSMMNKTFLPSLLAYIKELAETEVKMKKALPSVSVSAVEKRLDGLSALYTVISEKTDELKNAFSGTDGLEDGMEKVKYCRYTVLAKMNELRSCVDEAETIIPDEFLTYPSYEKLLFSI